MNLTDLSVFNRFLKSQERKQLVRDIVKITVTGIVVLLLLTMIILGAILLLV